MSDQGKRDIRRRLLWVVPLLFLFLAACQQGPPPTAGSRAVAAPGATAVPATLGAKVATPSPQPTATPLPTQTPLPSPTSTPTDTARPTATRRPTSTPRPSPTPAGFYADPGNGWSMQFPSEWEINEMSEGIGTIWVQDPSGQISLMAGGNLAETGETIEETIGLLTKVFTIGWEEAGETVTDTITLRDGSTAQRVTVINAARPPRQLQVVWAERGARRYVIVVSASVATFEARARTIEAVIGSLTLTSPRLYDVDRNTALVLAGSEPYDMDPATTEDGPSEYVGHLFRGLVMLDTELRVVPDLAERWEISDDGRIYTFYLHPDAVFFDGKPVTAADFKYAWERAADPELGSNKTSTYLGDVLGVKDKLAGEADEISGLAVVDDHTLQVTIDAPKVYFLAKLTWPVAFAVDQENVEAGGEEWWREPNGVGPFRIERWDDDVMIFARNETFYGPAPRLEHVVYLLDAGPSVRLYENGEVDMAGVGTDLVERVEDPADPLHDDLHTTANLCTTRVILDATRPPFDDPLVRQAFSYAVDRDEILNVVLKGALLPAAGPLPPGMPGYTDELAGYSFDPEVALDLIARSSYGDLASLPPLTFTTGGYTGAGSDVESLVETWDEVFGIEIEIELLDPFSYFDEIRDHHGHFFDAGWCADYPDPQNFLDVLYHTGSDENLGGYSNPEVDAWLDRAATEQDPARRLALYQQAEQAIVDDAASVWLWHSVSRLLIKSYVHGFVPLPMSVPQVQNVYLDPR